MAEMLGPGNLLQNPLAHFRRRLAGEGDGEDLFRALDGLQQADVALHQQLGLPRPRRRLDDERARDVERRVALRLVGGGLGASHGGQRSRMSSVYDGRGDDGG